MTSSYLPGRCVTIYGNHFLRSFEASEMFFRKTKHCDFIKLLLFFVRVNIYIFTEKWIIKLLF